MMKKDEKIKLLLKHVPPGVQVTLSGVRRNPHVERATKSVEDSIKEFDLYARYDAMRNKCHYLGSCNSLIDLKRMLSELDSNMVGNEVIVHQNLTYMVQQETGYGWEDLGGSFIRKLAMDDLKAYRSNQPGSYRIVHKRDEEVWNG